MMLWSCILGAALATRSDGPAPPPVRVSVDSAHHELTITSGPFDLPNMPPMESHAMMDLGMSHDTPIQNFVWPVDGWFRGYRVTITDAHGQPVPRHRCASPLIRYVTN